MIRALVVVVLAVSLSGCAGWGCDGWKKFTPSRADTAGTKSQALAHNEFGRKQSCWK